MLCWGKKKTKYVWDNKIKYNIINSKQHQILILFLFLTRCTVPIYPVPDLLLALSSSSNDESIYINSQM
jgi:hypothetical protein